MKSASGDTGNCKIDSFILISLKNNLIRISKTLFTICSSSAYATRKLFQMLWPSMQHTPRDWYESGISRFLSIMPNRSVRDKWDYPRKMERHFPIKPHQPIGVALATFDHFRIP